MRLTLSLAIIALAAAVPFSSGPAVAGAVLAAGLMAFVTAMWAPASLAAGVMIVRSPIKIFSPARAAARTSSSHTNAAGSRDSPAGAPARGEADEGVEVSRSGFRPRACRN